MNEDRIFESLVNWNFWGGSFKEELKEREIKSLLAASKDLDCDNLFVITNIYGGEKIIENKKIKFIPLWKWLLTF